MGLDAFLEGKKVVAAKVVAANVPPAPPGSPAPESSVPSAAVLKKQGYIGQDATVAGADVKGGTIRFYMIGGVPHAAFSLEPEARARLQSRLPGYTGSGPQPPTKPGSPVIPPFTPPPKPEFAISNEALHSTVMGVEGNSSKTKPDGTPVTKIEKHIHKWKNGSAAIPGSANYVKKALDKATEMAKSADPIEKAAGDHYVAEFLRIGDLATSGVFTLKDPSSVPKAEQEIKPFVVTDALKKAQDAAKANVEGAHTAAVAAAKVEHDKKVAGLHAAHEKELEAYEKEKTAYEKKTSAKSYIDAEKLSHYPMPTGVRKNSDQVDKLGGKGKVLDYDSEWGGDHTTAYVQGHHPSYNIDMSDMATQHGAVPGSKKKKLVANYFPDATSGNRKLPGRSGRTVVRFPEGSSPEQIKTMLAQVASHLGVDLKPATKVDQELTYLRKMAWSRRLEGYTEGEHFRVLEDKALGPDATTQQRVDYWAGRFEESPSRPAGSKGGGSKHSVSSRGIGFDPRYEVERTTGGAVKTKADKPVYKTVGGKKKPNPHYKPEPVDIGGGNLQWSRFDITPDELKKLGGTLSHSLSAFGETVFSNMSLQSTNMRVEAGVAKQTGKSPGEDVTTGGSNGTFLTIHSNAGHTYGHIEIDPRILQYTGAYSHPGDRFGSKVDYGDAGHGTYGRAGSVQEDEVLAESMKQSGGELMIDRHIDLLRWATRIKTTSAHRTKLLKELKAKGITHMGPDKKPIEDVITS